MTQWKMSNEQWIRFATSLQTTDVLHVFDNDLSGELIEFGSADKLSPDPYKFVDFLQPVHTFSYFGLGRGATVEADPKGTQWHVIDEYRDRVCSGKTRIIVDRHMDLEPLDINNIKMRTNMQIGKPYGWGMIIGTGLYRLVRDTFIGGWVRAWKWNTPFCSQNNPVCSQGVRLQREAVKKYYDVLNKLSKWENNTPQVVLNEFPNISKRVMDTYRIAKDNLFNY